MFSIFTRNRTIYPDYSFLGVDLHSHLVPAVDDGAKDLEDAIALLRSLTELGYHKVITTPHIDADYFPNTPQRIQSAFQSLRVEAERQTLPVELAVAAEYMINESFHQQLEAGKDFLVFGEKQILVEMSIFAPVQNLADIVFQLQTAGWQPVLAHPERYLYYQKKLDYLSTLFSSQCQFQINLLSLAGAYGKQQRAMGIALLEKGLVTYLGTDLHRLSQVRYLKDLLKDKKVMRLLAKQNFRNSAL